MFTLTTDQRVNRKFLGKFQEYVKTKGKLHLDRLNLYLACEGLKQQEDLKIIERMVAVVYRFAIQCKIIHEEDSTLGLSLVRRVQQDVKEIIFKTTYFDFLASKVYFDFVKSCESGTDFVVSSGLVDFKVKVTYVVRYPSSVSSLTPVLFLSFNLVEFSLISLYGCKMDAFVETARDHREWENKHPVCPRSSYTFMGYLI